MLLLILEILLGGLVCSSIASSLTLMVPSTGLAKGVSY